MSKTIQKLLFSVIALTFVLGVIVSPLNTEAASGKANSHVGRSNEANLVFPVISDLQMDTNGTADMESFREAMNQLNQLVPDRDALMILGDLTDHGYTEEYDRVMSIFNEEEQSQAVSLFAIGNHEYYNGLSAEGVQQRFLKRTGMESIYYHKKIKGYHFIVMGSERNVTKGYYSKEQIRWLGEQLKKAEADTPKKPIFVFIHHPLQQTVYGSVWGIRINKKMLRNTLEDYPQVIMFSGHSHYVLNNPRSIFQEDFTTVNTASISYTWIEGGYQQAQSTALTFDQGNQGLVVKVYNNQVIIKRRDFNGNQWIGEPWVVKYPAKKNKFKYTADRDHVKPFFKQAEISVNEEQTTANSLEIQFTQATDNLYIQYYTVVARNAKTGEIAKQFKAYSERYKATVPNPLTLPVEGLQSGTTYEITVKAVDAFGNESRDALRVTATTKASE